MKETTNRPAEIRRKKVTGKGRVTPSGKFSESEAAKDVNICANASCRLRKAGCRGFEGCPGYKSAG